MSERLRWGQGKRSFAVSTFFFGLRRWYTERSLEMNTITWLLVLGSVIKGVQLTSSTALSSGEHSMAVVIFVLFLETTPSPTELICQSESTFTIKARLSVANRQPLPSFSTAFALTGRPKSLPRSTHPVHSHLDTIDSKLFNSSVLLFFFKFPVTIIIVFFYPLPPST